MTPLKQSFHDTYQAYETVNLASNRSFGYLFVVIFTVYSLLPLIDHQEPRAWSLLVASVLLVITLVTPQLLTPLNRFWFGLSMVLHKITSPIVMGILFYGVVTPTGLIMRTIGYDPLRLKWNQQSKTYWIERTPPGPKPEKMSFPY